MKVYKLPMTLREPDGETGGRYLAEIPLLPGCRAWGESAAEAIENLQSVATAFIESYNEHGDDLPPEVVALASEAGSSAAGEVLIAV